MKKYLWLSLITIVLSFGDFGCSKKEKGFFARNGDYSRISNGDYSRISSGECPFFPSFQPKYKYINNSEIENLKEIFRQKGFEEGEIHWMAKIATEDYGLEVWPILYVGHHFIYGPFDGNTYCNCALYSVKRFLRHLGILGIIDQNLWYKWSDRQLRDIGVNELKFSESSRDQYTELSTDQITALVEHLVPGALPYLKQGSARKIAVKERERIIQDLRIINDLIEILETERKEGVEGAINMAQERKFTRIERLNNHRFNLDGLRNEISELQRRIDDYNQCGYFLGGTCGVSGYSRNIENLHSICEFLVQENKNKRR
jgi:hypothetical protein